MVRRIRRPPRRIRTGGGGVRQSARHLLGERAAGDAGDLARRPRRGRTAGARRGPARVAELEQTSAGALILQRFVVRFQQGRLAEESPALRRSAARGSVFRAGRALLAVAFAETGQAERGRAIARETLGADGDGASATTCSGSPAVALFSGVAAAASDVELLASRRRAHEPVRRPCRRVRSRRCGARHRSPLARCIANAALGRRDIALEHFAEADGDRAADRSSVLGRGGDGATVRVLCTGGGLPVTRSRSAARLPRRTCDRGTEWLRPRARADSSARLIPHRVRMSEPREYRQRAAGPGDYRALAIAPVGDVGAGCDVVRAPRRHPTHLVRCGAAVRTRGTAP